MKHYLHAALHNLMFNHLQISFISTSVGEPSSQVCTKTTSKMPRKHKYVWKYKLCFTWRRQTKERQQNTNRLEIRRINRNSLYYLFLLQTEVLHNYKVSLWFLFCILDEVFSTVLRSQHAKRLMMLTSQFTELWPTFHFITRTLRITKGNCDSKQKFVGSSPLN